MNKHLLSIIIVTFLLALLPAISAVPTVTLGVTETNSNLPVVDLSPVILGGGNTYSNITFNNITNIYTSINQTINITNNITTGIQNYTDIALTNQSTSWGINNITASWFHGLYNWIVGPSSTIYLSFNGSTLIFNEANLNNTINNRILNQSNGTYVPYTGATSNVDLNGKDLTNVSKLGIGTTAPESPLQVIGTNGLFLLSDVATDATAKVGRIGVPHYTNSEEPIAVIYGNAATANSNIINFGGGTNVFNAATNIRFWTTPLGNTLSGTERMRIDGSGNVGIGTTAPSALLEVNGTGDVFFNLNTGNLKVNGSGDFILTSSTGRSGLLRFAGGADNILQFGPGTSDVLRAVFGMGATNTALGGAVNTLPNGDVEILGNNSVVNAVYKNDGKVGIGTTTPTATLDVNGTMNITGNIKPTATATYSLGSSLLRWLNGWFVNLDVSGNISYKVPYATFTSNITQTLSNTTSVKEVTYTHNEGSYLISNVSSSRLLIQKSGLYHVEISPLAMASGVNKHLDIFPAIDDVAVPRSNSHIELPLSGEVLTTIPYDLTINAGQNLSFKWGSIDDAGMTLFNSPSTALVPESPSVILTINWMSEI